MFYKAYILCGSLVLINLGDCVSEPKKGCVVGEKYFAPGTEWREDCNSCYCKDAQDFCTRKDCHQITDSPLCRFLDIGECKNAFIKIQCNTLCTSTIDPILCEHVKKDRCQESAVLTMCPTRCSKPSNVTDIEVKAPESNEKVGFFDGANPTLAKVTDIKGKALEPIRKPGFFDGADPTLAKGDHTYCGPYKNSYSNAQCAVVGLKYGFSVQECSYLCDLRNDCTAFNWSGKKELMCVLRYCPGTPPMPVEVNPDVVSFSKRKPVGTPTCKNLHGDFKHISHTGK